MRCGCSNSKSKGYEYGTTSVMPQYCNEFITIRLRSIKETKLKIQRVDATRLHWFARASISSTVGLPEARGAPPPPASPLHCKINRNNHCNQLKVLLGGCGSSGSLGNSMKILLIICEDLTVTVSYTITRSPVSRNLRAAYCCVICDWFWSQSST